MKSSRFGETQIIGILKEHQAGLGAKVFGPQDRVEISGAHGIAGLRLFRKTEFV